MNKKIFSNAGLRHSQFNNYSLRNKLSTSIFDLNQTNGTADYSLESPDHINSLIDENIFNNLNGGCTSKLNHLNKSRKSIASNNLSNFVSNNNGLMNGNSSSGNSASSSSSSVTSFSSGYESSMRKQQLENNDQFNLDHLFHPLLAESIYETSTRLLFMAIKWTKSLPAFVGLNYCDQVSKFSIFISLYNYINYLLTYKLISFAFHLSYRCFFYARVGVICFYYVQCNGVYSTTMAFCSVLVIWPINMRRIVRTMVRRMMVH